MKYYLICKYTGGGFTPSEDFTHNLRITDLNLNRGFWTQDPIKVTKAHLSIIRKFYTRYHSSNKKIKICDIS